MTLTCLSRKPSWLLHSSLQFNLLGVQSINIMLTCQLSRFHAWIERRMEWKRSRIPCMYIFTYIDQYSTHAFAFCMSSFRTIDTSYTLRTRARYRRIKATSFVSCNYMSKHRIVASLK